MADEFATEIELYRVCILYMIMSEPEKKDKPAELPPCSRLLIRQPDRDGVQSYVCCCSGCTEGSPFRDSLPQGGLLQDVPLTVYIVQPRPGKTAMMRQWMARKK